MDGMFECYGNREIRDVIVYFFMEYRLSNLR